MEIRTLEHKKYITYDENKITNGFLISLYNINDKFFSKGKEPQQVYLTTILPQTFKGPHLHYIRTGYFTCILGNVKIVLKTEDGYKEFYSGTDYNYLSVEVPAGIPAVIQNIGSIEAILINMPNPAWTSNMNDEYSADFSDYFN